MYTFFKNLLKCMHIQFKDVTKSSYQTNICSSTYQVQLSLFTLFFKDGGTCKYIITLLTKKVVISSCSCKTYLKFCLRHSCALLNKKALINALFELLL